MILPTARDGDLVAETVYKRFGSREVLKGVFFRASPGRVTAVLGVNGCGKSTLFRLIAGVLRADAGRFVYGSFVSGSPSLARLARLGLSYLPQDPMLMNNMRVDAQLCSFAYGNERIEDVKATLDITGLTGRKPRQLSGGERRRCDLAAVLLLRPRYLLMDEPFTGLAPNDAERICAGLRSCAAAGSAVIITDHAIDFTLSVADDVWFLDNGSCRYVGDRDRAVEDPDLRRYYLGRKRARTARSSSPAA
jgi:lipopolysaccharide export system ATP-binding protein